MNSNLHWPLICVALAITSCHNAPTASESERVIPIAVSESANDCPVINSKSWRAWINKMPGNGSPTLHVTGDIALPMKGYQIRARLGPMDRRTPPQQVIFLNLLPPQESSVQTVTQEEVNISLPALSGNYRAIAVVCEGRQLVEITSIEDAL